MEAPPVVCPPKLLPERMSRRPKIFAPLNSKGRRQEANLLQKSDTSLRGSEQLVAHFVVRPPEQNISANPRRHRPPRTSRVMPIRLSAIVPNAPITPNEALREYSSMLTSYELTEILNYSEIYFLGDIHRKTAINTSSRSVGFDSNDHRYILSVGDHLAYRYEITHLLGGGAFGQVCKCVDHKIGEQVAVKVIVNTPQMSQQAVVERRVLGRLKKARAANVVESFDFFVFRGHSCITFEVLGRDLRTVWDSQTLGMTTVRIMAMQMFRALDHVHKCGIVHCDVKPDNAMLVPNAGDSFKLIDFGSSCFNGHQCYQYIQSRFYRAPEVILGFRYGFPIDVWGLALVIVEAVSGRPLFPGRNELGMLGMMMQVLGAPPPVMIASSPRRNLFFDAKGQLRVEMPTTTIPLERVLGVHDADLVDLLGRCLIWDPGVRLTAADAIEHKWFDSK